MKFDAVVGNPPYQENIANRGEQPPIYHLFYDCAISLSSIVTLITPARFLFDAGKTPSEWNNKMLNDEHFKVVNYFPNSKDVFSNVDIKGGVTITLRNNKDSFGAIENFIPDETIKSILQKVKLNSTRFLSDIIYSNTSYKYSDAFFSENPDYAERVSGGSSRYLSSSVFDKFPEAFYEIEPNDGETFVSFGSFDTIEEAENFVKYIKCKLTRLLLGTKKVTQGNKNAKVWSNVVIQDFTTSSDIDWSKTVSEIDRQLYKKYGLTEDEIAFIEEKVKPME